MSKKEKLFLYWLPIMIVLLGLGVYLFRFNSGFSVDHQAWGSFGSFLGLFVGAANIWLFVRLSILVYKYNHSVNQPILVIKTRLINGVERWYVVNIGNGPALNVVFTYKSSVGDWHQPGVKCYSIGKDQEQEFDWLNPGTDVDVIGLTYNNMFQERFVVIGADDTTMFSSWPVFKTFEINCHKYERHEVSKLFSLSLERMGKARSRNASQLGSANSPSLTFQTTSP